MSIAHLNGMEIHVMPSGATVAFDEDAHRYYLVTKDNVVPLESVTQTLGVCPKPGLPWWGMKVGVAGVWELYQRGLFNHGQLETILPPPDQLVALLQEHSLDVNNVRDSAGARGDEVHDIAEALASGVIPDLESVDPERRGYAEALVAAWLDLAPEPIQAEAVVCSVVHGIAGKFDLRARIPEGRTAVTDAETGYRESVPAGVWILDYKTSKGVYEQHVLQGEAYDGLSVESGYDAADDVGVIRLLPDGRYELVASWVTWDEYLAALGFFRALEQVKATRPRRPRKCQRGEHHFKP
ncbi:MAG: hypothetical protein ACXVHX_22810, partial [Solirubrobacteraceae bacterium]